MQTSTSGGSSDSDAKALTVMPFGWWSSSLVVTTVTPLAKRLMALRNSSLLTGIAPRKAGGRRQETGSSSCWSLFAAHRQDGLHILWTVSCFLSPASCLLPPSH